jgi:hypothetical protein
MTRRKHLAVSLLIIALMSVAIGRAEAAGAAAGKSPLKADTPFRIVATDGGFVAPARVPAGMRHIVLHNRGREIHEAMLIRLPDGMDAAGYVSAVKAGALFPEGALDYSGPTLTAPGATSEIWARIDPGRYVLICWNGDHARTRRAHAFEVTAEGAHDDTPPPADVVLKLVDFRFELSRTPHKGTQVLRIDTVGPSMHEAGLYRLLPGKTVADLLEWRKQDGNGEAPAIPLGGVLDSHDIRRQIWMRHTFVPGHYVLHCEMPMSTDAKAGTKFATHADAGMVAEFMVAD